MGHDLQKCKVVNPAEKDKIRNDPPFSLALKAKLNLLGRESLKFNTLSKKSHSQCSYIGNIEKNPEMHPQKEEISAMSQEIQDNSRLIAVEQVMKRQKEGMIDEGKDTEKNYIDKDFLKPIRKSS
ncbi:hypothetical protein PVK06_011041 [Gossypium arboreum]|uniref:Uncharacterized protein n=1 Tax=Gossypium arboreum TaxID=29729 RepID=A0ABR0Q8P4_GOSAR|nr:hypothetical protein PVK06_011041 [Gossypium arboreum]